MNLRWTFQDLDYLWLTLVDAESAALWFCNIRADKGTRWNDNRAGGTPRAAVLPYRVNQELTWENTHTPSFVIARLYSACTLSYLFLNLSSLSLVILDLCGHCRSKSNVIRITLIMASLGKWGCKAHLPSSVTRQGFLSVEGLVHQPRHKTFHLQSIGLQWWCRT